MLDGRFIRAFAPFAVAVAVSLAGRTANAAEPIDAGAGSARERAATAYDEAVRLSRRADYEPAARKFLEADAIAPSADALSNAIAAARRANAHLLVAEAAHRAVGREASEPELAARARVALAEAELRLSRFELSCRPEPCELELDGDRVTPGRRYALPGVHVVSATAPNGQRTDERLSTAAGVEYVVALEVAPPASTPAVVAPPLRPDPPPAPFGTAGSASEPSPATRPLRPWVFYLGLGTTLALAGVTVWSGVDTLNAKSDLPNPSTESKNDDVLGRARRTDWLFSGTLVVAAASAAVGLVWVDWGSGERAGLTASPVPGGAVVGFAGAR